MLLIKKQQILTVFLVTILLSPQVAFAVVPFKIHIDKTEFTFDISGSQYETGYAEFFDKAIDGMVTYFQELLQMEDGLYFSVSPGKCENFQINHQTGFQDTHYYLYLKPNLSGSGFINAHHCFSHSSKNRPYVGIFEINIGQLQQFYKSQKFQRPDKIIENTGFLYFQMNLKHELFHLLGMNKHFWYDNLYHNYSGSEKIIIEKGLASYRKQYSQVLKTPKVISAINSYFSCPQTVGAQLENYQLEDYPELVQHWEAAVLADDIMSYSSPTLTYSISQITLAMMQDTNWYKQVNLNMAENMVWGYNKGCDFYKQGCYNAKQNYTEYDSSQLCTHDYLGKAISREDFDQPLDGCSYVQGSYQGTCSNKQHKFSDVNQSFESFNENSRCFSTVLNKGSSLDLIEKASCLTMKCIDGIVIVELEEINQKFQCRYTDQLIFVSSGTYSGHIRCPEIKRICQVNQQCPNNCSSNGYCVNGKCHCLDQYGGVDCFVKCLPGQYVDFLTKQCKTRTECPPGQYLFEQHAIQSVHTCLACYEGCLTCTGSDYNQCSICETSFLKHPQQQTTCVTNTCNDANCNFCLSDQKCIECKNNSIMQIGNCVETCSSGFYLVSPNGEKQCLLCPSDFNCELCARISTVVTCQKCSQELNDKGAFIYKLHNDKCQKECPYGYFQAGQTCLHCDQGCDHCFGPNSGNCLKCKNSKLLYKGECLNECPVNYKDNNGVCVEDLCDVAKKDGECDVKCDSNEFIRNYDRFCIKCDEKCLKCADYPDKCIACHEDETLYNYQCIQQTGVIQNVYSQLRELSGNILKLTYNIVIIIMIYTFF